MGQGESHRKEAEEEEKRDILWLLEIILDPTGSCCHSIPRMKLNESPLDLTGRFSPSGTSDSGVSTSSSVSLRSDASKHELINFKGRLSPRLRHLFTDSPLDSTESCSPSMSDFSSASVEEDVAADDEGYDSASDSDESTASGVSIKSDESKDELIDFKGQLSPRLRKENEEKMKRKLDESGLTTNQE